MAYQTATYISTDDFNSIIVQLKQNKWRIRAEYISILSKGIDFDFYILKKEGEEILLAWDPYDESSMKADPSVLEWLELKVNTRFRYGNVKYLRKIYQK